MKQLQEYAVCGGMWSPFLEQATMLIGMENLMMPMYDNPELVELCRIKLYDLAKSYGYVVQQHSCGSVVKIRTNKRFVQYFRVW